MNVFHILHILNVADFCFIAAGIGAALLMILAGGHGDEGADSAKAARVKSRLKRE